MTRNITMPDIALPFFDYGLFKPGQICYYKIQKYVEKYEQAEVPGKLKERDGVPLLIPKPDYNKSVKGYIIYFNVNCYSEAYKKIDEINTSVTYRWSVMNISNIKVNLLLHKDGEKHCEEIEYEDNWQGKDDPIFSTALKLIEKTVDENNEYNGENSIFKLQMAYMLLWSSIERYIRLKNNLYYDNNFYLKDNLMKDDFFFKSINECKLIDLRPIKNVGRNTYTLYHNEYDIGEVLGHYYQLRNNIVHRGKTAWKDHELVRDATKNLLSIFRKMLDYTFDQKNDVTDQQG